MSSCSPNRHTTISSTCFTAAKKQETERKKNADSIFMVIVLAGFGRPFRLLGLSRMGIGHSEKHEKFQTNQIFIVFCLFWTSKKYEFFFSFRFLNAFYGFDLASICNFKLNSFFFRSHLTDEFTKQQQ